MVTHYRWDFIGLSTDDKPTPAISEKVTDGSTFYCSDNSKLYVWYKNQWYEKTSSGGGGGYVLPIASSETLGGVKVGSNLSIDSETGVLDATDTTYSAFTGTDGETAGTAGLVPAPATTDADKFLKSDGSWATAGGGAKVLSTADYNYPSGSPTEIALWMLDTGTYILPRDVKARVSNTIAVDDSYDNLGYVTIFLNKSNQCNMLLLGGTRYGVYAQQFTTTPTTGNTYTFLPTSGQTNVLLSSNYVKDNLTSTDTNLPLSANQGKVLKDLIDALDTRITALGG